MAHPGGRPTKYHDGMPQILIDAMQAGKSVTRFCADQDISKPTFYKWVDEIEEFSYAFSRAKEKCESHWEDWLINHLEDKNVNAGLVKMYFTNRFGWADKQEVKQDTTHSLAEPTARKVRKVLDGE